jgi:hypothetical protein
VLGLINVASKVTALNLENLDSDSSPSNRSNGKRPHLGASLQVRENVRSGPRLQVRCEAQARFVESDGNVCDVTRYYTQEEQGLIDLGGDDLNRSN